MPKLLGPEHPEPMLHSKRIAGSEKPTHHTKSGPWSPEPEKSPWSNKDAAQQK